jgi:putative intracellular protease/amidase
MLPPLTAVGQQCPDQEESIMRIIVRCLLYLAAFILPIMVSGGLGVLSSLRTTNSLPSAERAATTIPPPAPPYDPTKPTVAIVLGNSVSEVSDTLGPYATFAESGLYNVYTVASTRTLRTLTGGLDLLPHFSFTELEARLGHSPDIVVVPAMTSVDAPDDRPVLDWIRQQAQGTPLVFSWCTGARVLAAAGVLDGKPATAHWGDLDRLERHYPAVHWQRGVRYVESGRVLTSAGITSGFDATLYLLAQRHGAAVADRVARALQYQPPVDLVAAPVAEQYTFGWKDSVYLFNLAFNWNKRDAGVWLYDGIGDLELAAVLDSYATSWTTRTITVAASRGVVTSQYGLQFVPRSDVGMLPSVDRLLEPGSRSTTHTDASLTSVAGRIAAPIARVHDTVQARFAFEAPLEDLAREENVATAAFAARRLEYRAASLQLHGRSWPILLTLQPVLIGVGGVCLMRWLMHRFDRRRHQRRTVPIPAGAATAPVAS